MAWQDLPPVLLYPRLIPHILKLCLKYKTTLAVITQANPLFPYGGLPFAPKDKMCTPFRKMLPLRVIPSGWSLEKKLEESKRFTREYGYPAVLKPNTGHRGVDVHLVESGEKMEKLLRKQTWDYMLQRYSPAPLEFGIFFCKLPGESEGRIISLTKKVIPVLSGDGTSTIRQIIEKSSIENKKKVRNKLQEHLDEVLPPGEKLKSMICASHSRGSMFFNAAELWTEQLHKSVNDICNIEGFDFGRLDVKAESDEALMAGEFEIVEVNGATSESIHIYDSKISYKEGIAVLKKQWEYLFAIAVADSRKRKTMKMGEFLRRYLYFFNATKQANGTYW